MQLTAPRATLALLTAARGRARWVARRHVRTHDDWIDFRSKYQAGIIGQIFDRKVLRKILNEDPQDRNSHPKNSFGIFSQKVPHQERSGRGTLLLWLYDKVDMKWANGKVHLTQKQKVVQNVFIRGQYCSTKFSTELVLNSNKFSNNPLAKLYDIRVSFESLIWSGWLSSPEKRKSYSPLCRITTVL